MDDWSLEDVVFQARDSTGSTISSDPIDFQVVGVNSTLGTDDNESMNSILDSDGDEIVDTDDDCPELSGLSTYPVTGCPDDDSDGWANTYDKYALNRVEWSDTDVDNVGDDSDQCPNSEPDESIDASGCKIEESDILMYTAVGAGGITGATLLFFLLPRMMRNMNADEAKDRMKWEDEIWQEPQGMPEGPPIEQVLAPDPGLTGETQKDGYEYLEWPAASGDWWYRVGTGMDWAKWEK